MTNEQKINRWFSRFEHRFNETVPNIVAETATEFFKERFSAQEWNGAPWKPLNLSYAEKKTRGRGKILTRSGALLNSIRPSEVNPNKVVISAGNSKVPYARAHNEGLRIQGVRKVRSYTNSNFMGSGKQVQIPRHSRRVNFTMPKRQFMGHSNKLNKRITTRLIKAFKL